MILFASQTVQFDVYVKSNVAGMKFSDANIEVKYPTDIFGENVVSNGNLQAAKEVVATNPAYSLTTQDLSSDRFVIEVGTDCQYYESSYALSTVYEKLVRITLSVENWAALLNWQSQSIQAAGSAKYFETAFRCADFPRICFDYRLEFAPCNITSVKVAPFAAGILQTITFTGSGFGGNLGQNPLAKVDIPNAENGGASNIVLSGADQDYVVNWQDNEVVLRISSMVYGSAAQTMGSGVWKITPNLISSSDFCSIVVDIDYALTNTPEGDIEKMVSLAQNVYNPNVPDDGALEWYIDDGIDMDLVAAANGLTFANVEQVAMQAFCDWEIASGLEFRYMGPLNNANNSADYKNAIFLGNTGGNAKAQTEVVFTTETCTDDTYFRGHLLEFNIMVDRQTSWYASTGTSINANRFDLYSVLIHEIGHGILLKHSMDTDPDNSSDDDRIMYYGLQSGQIKRDIDGKTKSGIALLKDRTIQSIDKPDGCFFPDDGAGNKLYDLNIYPVGCAVPTVEANNHECQIILPTLLFIGQRINFMLPDSDSRIVQMVSTSGQIASHFADYNGTVSIPTENLTQGVYFLRFNCGAKLVTRKVIVLR